MPSTTNFGWTTPADTDLVKDGASAIRTLGNGIDTSFVDLKGGTTGQMLVKNSNSNMDFVWQTPNVGDITEVQAGTGISIASGTGPIPIITNTVTTTIDAEGDLLVGDAADALQRLPIGSNGTVLTVDTSVDGKIKWSAPVAGKVGQVLSTLKTDTFSTTSSSFVTITGLSQTITPSLNTSKVLIVISLAAGVSNADSDLALFAVSGGNSATYIGDAAGSRKQTIHWIRRGGDSAISAATNQPMTMVYLDSPATTSAVTYNATAAIQQGTAYVNRSGIDSDNSSWGRSASTITVMEILA